jgi:hypothetical protein
MKPMNSIYRGAFALLGAFALAGAMPTVAVAQGVVVNGNPVCTDAPNLTLTPAGTVTMTCTAVSTNPNGPPACTVGNVNVATAGTGTVTASCTPAATSYTWATTDTTPGPFPSPVPTGSSWSIQFPTAGTFHYAMQASNANGVGNVVNFAVSVADAGACGGLLSSATWSALTVNSGLATVPQNSYYSFKLPVFPTAGKTEIFNAINSSNPGVAPLPTEFTVSACPGDFTNFVPSCKVYGTPDNGAITLSARMYAPGTSILGGCGLRTGIQYYLNVRNVDSSNVNACPVGQCSLIVQHHGS